MARSQNRNKARNKRRRKQAKLRTSLGAAPGQAGAAAHGKQSPGKPAPAARRFPVMSGIPLPTALSAFALCALVAAAFFPATGAGFVWDDIVLTEAAPLQHINGLWQIWFAPRSLSQFEGHYWPLLYTTFWLEHRLWGTHPLGYHIVNIVLHAAVTLTLWRLLSRLKVPGAWLAAAVFAVHPVHVESVAWVIGRKDVLASLFYFAAALCYLRCVDERWRGFYLASLALFVAGLLSKSILVTLPLALFILHWWRHGRITAADGLRVLPFLLIAVAAAIADTMFYKARDPTAFDYSFIERAQLAAKALWFYAHKLVWPADLAVIYPRWTVAADAFGWAALVGGVGVIAALWSARHRITRGPLAGALFFIVALAPTLGLIDYGYMRYSFVADRYQYLAGVGVIVVVCAAAVVAARAFDKLPAAVTTVVATVSAAVVLTMLATLTWQQAGIYQNKFTFYRHIIAHNADARGAHYNLGLAYQQQGKHEDALTAFEIERALSPGAPAAEIRMSQTHTSAAASLAALGRHDDAEQHYRRAVQLAPDFPRAHESLGAFLLNQRRYRDALDVFRRLVFLAPGDARFPVGVGVALAGLGRVDEAIQHYDRALTMNPHLEQARRNRDNLLRARQPSE